MFAPEGASFVEEGLAPVVGVGVENVFIPEPGVVSEPPPPPTAAELKKMRQTFKDAKDQWKVDGATMKCLYLHSESGYLYCWDQPTGILYEYAPSTGQCQAVWTAAVPQLNAELWTVLPMPPTDPASLQASIAQSGYLPNIDVYLNLTVAHESGYQMPRDVMQSAVEDFIARWSLRPNAQARLKQMTIPGQFWVMQNFRDDSEDPSKALVDYVHKLQRRNPPLWGTSACTLRVESTGAIIGRCCPDLDALCRQDPPERLAQAHCKIMSEEDRFFLCDLNASKEGTLLDGFPVHEDWVGPLKSGSLLEIGPLRIKIQLSDMAKDTPASQSRGPRSMKRGLDDGDDDDGAEWKRKVWQKDADWDKKEQQRRQAMYKDRAEERRKRHKGEEGSVAIETLVNKFERIREAEKRAEEAEEARVEMPAQEHQREANMNVDGTFIGFGQAEGRAGIGFGSSASAELIPNVMNPKALSPQEAARLKTQLRFQQANSRG
eukprot:TRINITY_DN81123_c0_g1_i1.p1 TRINITY_DN81123_c0_g1~~TRINITY_DN81123_c0_g1_i1.p1  ORF type:complete len:490 (-),score=129.00 TRINITY_DN81123_c0_g1_i1:134-1603(-)